MVLMGHRTIGFGWSQHRRAGGGVCRRRVLAGGRPATHAARGRLMGALPRRGTMASIATPASDIEPYLARCGNRVCIAAINAPTDTVVSGEADEVAAIVAHFAEQGIQSKSLTVSHAFHSALLDPMLEEFSRYASEVRGVLQRAHNIHRRQSHRSVGQRADRHSGVLGGACPRYGAVRRRLQHSMCRRCTHVRGDGSGPSAMWARQAVPARCF
ncbi:hypothetical protein C2W62_08405 [Candidatus Entotheonella serta]|nr:hypothetical protein C2W62_08405 [Candidatus Entotheonella serta]